MPQYLTQLLIQLIISMIALLALVLPTAICHVFEAVTNLMQKGGKQGGFIKTTEITCK
jgi:hypothetical protein